MKLRAPDGCTSVSHNGRSYGVAADGSLEVEESVAAALAAHGFVPWGREAPRDVVDIESLNRPALFALLREKGVHVALPISNAELRAAARQAVGATGDPS